MRLLLLSLFFFSSFSLSESCLIDTGSNGGFEGNIGFYEGLQVGADRCQTVCGIKCDNETPPNCANICVLQCNLQPIPTINSGGTGCGGGIDFSGPPPDLILTLPPWMMSFMQG